MQDEVLEFWFGRDARADELVKNVWFRKSDAFDQKIADEFGDAVERALAGEFDDWATTPRGCIALVILLDQFTRNIFRGTPRAFAGDEKALATTRKAVAEGWDTELPVYQRAFLYIPFEHAEDDAAQEQSIEAFEGLRDDVGAEHQRFAEMFLDYAHKHKDIIDRFGRYPHRNEILGRETTPEEAEFLTQPDSSF